tara:strand:+ start:18165 stop:33218 length:15054 start_codon:yes stop_codon:yes gene_type:complete
MNLMKRIFTSIILISLITSSGYAQLSGTKTIGGASPDYTSIGAAITALQTSGVNGPVTFNIRQGTYTERMSLTQISGVNSTNTLTFQSDPSNTQMPIVQYSSTSAFDMDNNTVRFNGTDFTTIKGLHLKALSSSYGGVVYFVGTTANNKITDCKIEGISNPSTGSNYHKLINCASGTSHQQTYTTISNNEILNGYYSVYFWGGSSSSTEFGNVISGNTITNFTGTGITCVYQNQINVSGNEVVSSSTNHYASGVGVQLNQCRNGGTISNNKIVTYGATSQALYLHTNLGSSTLPFKVYNNFISALGSTGRNYSVWAYRCHYFLFYFNSVYNNGITQSSCFYMYSGGSSSYNSNQLRNNNTYAKNGYGVHYESNTYYNTYTSYVDYNNWYSAGTYPVRYLNNQYTSTSAWNSATGQDANGLSVDPGFYSSTNLHTNAVALNGKGQALSGYSTDIDGETRNSTTPDIGADEFSIKAVDAGVSAINNTYCAGTDTVKVTIRNNGTSALTSVSIGWKVRKNNGTYIAGTAYSWTGSIASGVTKEIGVGTYNFPSDTNVSILAYTYNPNSTTDSIPGNDTLETGNFKTKMSGVYTIGGASPSYTTIAAALSDLSANGVCGPTTFHIRQGTYSGQVTLTSYPGVSATNRLTFMADPANISDVILTNSGYTIYFNGANYTTIKNLKIQGTSSSRRVFFGQATTGVQFEGNTIVGYNINNTSTSYSTVYSSGVAHTKLKFINNTIQYGSYGMYLIGSSSIVGSDNVFSGNTFENFYRMGAVLQYLDEVTFSGNTIKDKGTYSNVYSVRMLYCDLTKSVSNNVIVNNSTNSGYGLNFYRCFNTSSNRGLVYNNMVSMLRNAGVSQIGIYHEYSNYLTTAFNSVYLRSTYSSSHGISFYSGDQNSLYNNNVVCSGGYPIYTNSTANVDFSNFNNLYSSGSYVAYWGGARSSIVALNSYSGKDGNSISTNVTFDATDDLHTNTIALDGAGTPISGISTDIDGHIRNASTPDIGADEFIVVNNDAGLTVAKTEYCSGANAVGLTLKNYGKQTLTSTKVNWGVSKNGGSFVAQTQYSWTGSLAPGASTQISFGSFSFSKDTSYVIRAYTTLPNSTLDSNTTNDTVTSTSFKPALSGVYTIGGASPDYSTIASAVSDLNTYGVCGPTTFHIRQGIYNEQLVIADVNGVTDTSRVTFRNDPSNTTAAILTYSSYPVLFNGGDYFTIKGLQIQSTSSSYRVYFAQNSTGIELDSNKIIGYNVNSPSTSYIVIYSSGRVLNDLKITKNEILYGSYGMHLNMTNSTSNVEISNNRIEDFYYQGVYLVNSTQLTVRRNYIEDRGTYSNVYSINMSNCDYLKEISNNTIINNSTSTSYGIYMANCNNLSTSYGMIYNNMISLMRTSSVYQYGIYHYYSGYQTVAFNTINSLSTYNYRSYGFYYYYGNNINQYDNNIKMNRGYAIYTRSSGTIQNSDYNNLFTNGSYLGYWNGNRTNLAAWKSASSKDVNTLSLSTTFKSNRDLHIANGANVIKSKGTPVSGITTDIDGDVRDTSTPDIGADETAPIPDDAGVSETKEIYCVGSNPFEVTLKNYGTNNLTSATINIFVQTNGGLYVAQTPYNWTGNLAKGQDTLLKIGTNNFLSTTSYSVVAFTTLPNGKTDTANYNDTAYSATSQPGLSGTYTVGGSSYDYATPVAALSALRSSNICGPVTFHIRQGTYSGQLNFSPITGSSPTNTVTFMPDPANTSPAILTHSSYALYFNGLEYLTVKGLQIKGTGAGYRVYFQKVGENTLLDENHIIGYSTSSTSSSYTTIYGNTGIDHGNLTISNNKIEYGTFGIRLHSISNNHSKGLTIKDNEVTNFLTTGIEILYIDELTITGNYVKDRGSYGGVTSINANNCNYDVVVAGNEVVNNSTSTGTGIVMYNCLGTTLKPNRMYNNSVVITRNTSVYQYGLSIQYCTYLTAAFNSVNSLSTRSNAYGVYVYQGDQVYFYNNNIGTKNGYPLYTNTTSNIDGSNHNNYYSASGSYVAYWAGNRTSISNLNSATGKDGNSIDVNPGFYSTTNLHSRSTSIDSAGTPVSGLTVDIDGETRNTVKPDIGCDEFLVLKNDAGIDSISTSVCKGTSPVYAQIVNFGTTTLTSAKVNWAVKKANGSFVSQTQYSWSGSLAPEASAIISIGNYNYQPDTTYEVLAYTTLPNTIVDSANGNDTFQTASFKTSMSGTYTIGGSGASYTTVAAAISDLNTYGVCGAITFNIRQGTYNEQLTLNNFEGLSSTNRITFQPDPSNTSDVVLYSTYPVYINGANFITIKGLKITGNGSGYRVLFNQNAEGVIIDGNEIVGFNTTSSGGYYTLFANNVKLKDCQIINNDFTYGTYAMYIQGPSSNRSDNVTIANNSVKDFVRYGMYLRYMNNLTVERNHIEDRGSYNNVYSIFMNYIQIKKITRNTIINRSTSTGYGLYAEYLVNSNFVRGIIANNMISITRNASVTQYGMYFYYGQYQTIVYNSINSLSSRTSAYGINAYYGDQLSLYNNNISTNRGYPLYTNSTSNIDFSNHNNLYTKTGSYVAYWAGNRSSITALTSYSGKDGNSLKTDPDFTSSTDLHTRALALDGAGTPISGISSDFDGQARNTVKPDIGADEFIIVANDAAIDSISNAYCVGSNSIKVRLVNSGSAALTSAVINWKIKKNNGSYVTQTPYSWSGNIAVDKDAIVSYGNYTFGADTTYDIVAWTTLPNGVLDSNTFNDTDQVSGFKTSMSGTYTIGGSSPSYTTIALALADLNNYGVCGPTTFNIRQGTYNEQINLTAIEGVDSVNRITFQSDPANSSQAIVRSSSYVVYFNGADYITIKNLNLQSSSSGNRVYYARNATGLILDSNRIVGYNYNSTSTSYSVIRSSSVVLTDCKIVRNTIQYGSYGMYMTLNGVSSRFEISDNLIDDFYRQGIYISNVKQLTINGNQIEDKSSYSNVYSLYIGNCDNISSIANNVIINNSTGTAYGIYLQNCDNTSGNEGLIYNNMISLTRYTSNYHYGIYHYYSNYLTTAFNSIYCRSTNYRSTSLYYYYGSNNKLYSNIFKMQGGVGLWVNTTSAVSKSENNLYNCTGSYTGYWSGYRSSLSQLQSASGKEQNSISGTVNFVSTRDLHVATGSNLNKGKGKAVAGITTDIDGHLRAGNSPDIGADESAPVPNDAGIASTKDLYCVGSNPFEVRLQNFGTNTLTSATINIWVQSNGGSYVAQTPYSWTGSLAVGADTLLKIGSYNFLSTTTYSIVAYTTSPNGNTDGKNYNDTAKSATSKPGLSGTYTVGGSGANYSTPAVALSALNSSGICGPVVFNIRPGTYSGQLQFGPINGSSSTNTITFQADPANTAAATIEYSSNTLYFNGMEYVTIKGLTIKGTGSSHRIYFNKLGTKTVLDSNSIIGYYTSSNSTNYTVIRGVTTADYGNLTLKNNLIQYGSNGMYLTGYSASISSGLTIENNTFKDFYRYGMYIDYNNEMVIEGNTIEDRSNSYDIIGIYLYRCHNLDRIAGNIIIGKTTRSSIGIYLNDCQGSSSDRAMVYNNSISLTRTSSVNQSGINSYYSTNTTIAFNSINLQSTYTSSYGIYAYQGNEIHLYNNNVAVNYGYALYTNSTSNIDASNYNNWYKKVSYLAYWAGNRSTLGQLQSASGKDGNSKSVVPGYYSTTNLHTNSATLNGAGTPVAGITTDIDGDIRSTSTPDIGSDEFSLYNIGVVSLVSTDSLCAKSDTVKVKIKNYGTLTVTSATINWYLKTASGSYVVQTPYSYSGSLAPNAEATVTLGTFNFLQNNTYTLRVITDKPNGAIDGNKDNDSLHAPIVVHADPATNFPTLSPLCIDASSLSLTSGTPTGGTYSGTGVSSGSFSPSTAGVGSHVLTYTVTSSHGCVKADTSVQVVNALPTVSFSNLSAVCVDASAFSLSGGTPTSGTYTGTGVSSGSFNAASAGSGSHVITYTHTDTKGCKNSDTSIQVVNSLPTVSLSLSAICVSNPAFNLSGGSPTGGTYSGTGVSSGSFSAATAGVGSHSIVYSYTDGNSCTNKDTAVQVVNALPNVSFTSLSPICSNASSFALSGGSPSGSGGVYTGTGVSGGLFNPTTAGSGNHKITYTYTDANNCSDTASQVQRVNLAPSVSLANLAALCTNNNAITLTGGSPSGGTYSGTGVSGGSFNPGVAGSGNHVITYSYTDGNSCSDSAKKTQVVNSTPLVSLTLSPVCSDTGTFALGGGTPTGGTFSGTGVTSNSFNSSTAGVGSHLITYTYTNSNNCTSSDTASQIVKLSPTVSFSSLSPICYGVSAFSLSGGSPSGGSYSGTGVSSGSFNSTSAGTGSHLITYKYTSSNGCSAEDTSSQVVKALPTVSHSALTSMCAYDTAKTLSGGTPTGGIYTGTGVSSGKFSPTTSGSGTFAIKYTVTGSNSCVNDTTVNQFVSATPVVSISSISSQCVNSPAVILTGSTPSGGVYTGKGISGGKFHPDTAGAGTHSIIYTYTNSHGCFNKDTTNVTVDTVPVVSLASMSDVCVDTSAITLSGGTPLSGTYKGVGVSLGVFSAGAAGAGSHLITYVYTDANNCTDSSSTSIVVNALPVVSFTLPRQLCLNATLTLNTGTPAGGVYSGTKVSGGVYSPTVAGLDSITYSYTDTNNCSNEQLASIAAVAPPSVTFANIKDICFGTIDSLSLTHGLPNGGFYKGPRTNSSAAKYAASNLGTDTLWYVVTQGVCTDSSWQTVTVHSLPVVNLSLNDVCDNVSPFSMTGGTPFGGVYIGKAIAGNIYTPVKGATGNDTIRYAFEDINGCSDTASTVIQLFVGPNTSLTVPDSLCSAEDSVQLNGGLPAGGTYSGDGIVSTHFDPMKITQFGLVPVTYTYTDANNCSDTSVQNIVVSQSPTFSFGNDTTICDDQVLVLKSGYGSGFKHVWSNGSSDTSINVFSKGTFSLLVYNVNAPRCAAGDTINVTYEAICVSIDEQFARGVKVSYYPNPSRGMVHARMEGFENLEVQMKVVNMHGQVVLERIWMVEEDLYENTIDLTFESNGVYFVHLQTNSGSVVHRISISK